MIVGTNKNMEFIAASKQGERRILLCLLPVFLLIALGSIWGTAVIRGKEGVTGQTEVFHTYIGTVADALEEGIKMMETLPKVDGSSLLTIYSLAGAGVDIEELKYENGRIAITAVSDGYRGGLEYAEALKECGQFQGVSYEGFSGLTEPSRSGYKFYITVYLERGSL